jgi:transcriptional regulator with PAS, ATPase and Fis domain
MIVGRSPALLRALALVERYARTRLSILLVGPTGTGKELLAQYLHHLSGRDGPMVDVNCCVLPRDMADSLLFGHTRGAFTGAITSTVGHIERAHGGTLFLDEIGSLPHDAQGKLLRVLETSEVLPLGAGAKRTVDLRVVAAAQDVIREDVRSGTFRLDLFQRVAGVVIELPALAERPEDVVPIGEHFAKMQGQRLEPASRLELLKYDWPGNVRELRSTIERASKLVANDTLSGAAILEAIQLGVLMRGPAQALDERRKLVRECEARAWDVQRITRELHIGRTTLFRRLRELGVSLREAKKYHFVSGCSEQTGAFYRDRRPETL